MNIYETDASGALGVDLHRAATELRSVGAMSEGLRRAAVAEIQTAALLDIAGSLRVLAAEAAAAMPDDNGVERPDEIDDPKPEERDFLIVGDLVLADGYDEPGEVTRLGVSEGATWAEITLASGAIIGRVWAENLTRLVGDEAVAIVERNGETIGDGVTIATLPVTEADEAEAAAIVAADHVDEIDDDFDGDEHGEAKSALDVLRANEAERKAAKKKAAKK